MNLGSKKFKLILSLVVAGLTVAVAAYAGEHGGEGQHELLSHAKLVDFGWRVMNFSALLFIVIKYLVPPLAKILSDRRTAIASQFEDLHDRRSEVEKTYKEYETKLGNIDQEVESILKTAKAQAEAEKERIIGDAQRAAEDIKRKAEVSVQNELSKAQNQLREEVAEQAAAMASEIIKKDFTEADQTKMVEDYLVQVGAMA
jgi:F-type H+-transporting ATPase subunit b